MNPIELGKFIASLRNEKNLTQEELAEILYIDKRKISRWECGTSVPEFDMLIKLSEILDVSLYELSIAKRIENEKLTKKIINKFKTIKDYKRFNTRKRIKIIIFLILGILLLITSTYTIKYNDTVEIYQLDSADENYFFDGNYIRTNDFSIFYIKQISILRDNKKQNDIPFNNCEYEISDNNKRLFYGKQSNSNIINSHMENNQYILIKNNIINLRITCLINKNIINNYNFNVRLIKTYNNKLF